MSSNWDCCEAYINQARYHRHSYQSHNRSASVYALLKFNPS